MIFQFDHVGLDHLGGKWNVGRLDLRDLKASFGRWQTALAAHGWNSLYWNNHDQPRIVSRWGNDREHWYASRRLWPPCCTCTAEPRTSTRAKSSA